MSKIQVQGIDLADCVVVLVPHNHKQPVMRCEVINASRGLVEVDTSYLHGGCSLVLIDGSGRRHVLAHGDVNL